MAGIKVVVNGALGKMGQTIIATLKQEPGIEVVGGVDVRATEGKIPLDAARSVPLSSNLESILTSTKPDVLVDFTVPAAVMGSVRITVKHGVNLVIGTTGLKPENIAEIKQLAEANNICAFVAPNFALGAVLMMAMAKLGAKATVANSSDDGMCVNTMVLTRPIRSASSAVVIPPTTATGMLTTSLTAAAKSAANCTCGPWIFSTSRSAVTPGMGSSLAA